MLAKLTLAAREHINDLRRDADCTYEDMKRQFLARVGLCARELQLKLFEDYREDTRNLELQL